MRAFRAVLRFMGKSVKRVGVTIAGFLLVLAGVVMLLTPGPGWAAIFLGLAVLGTEYAWARRALDSAKARARQATDRIRRRRPEVEPVREVPHPRPGNVEPEHPSA